MSTDPHRVWVVLRDETLRESVCRAVRLQEHLAFGFADLSGALASPRDVAPVLVILEPSLNGAGLGDASRTLRERAPAAAVLLVVPQESDVDASPDGADDYLAQPFSVREIMTRVKLLLRRAALKPGATYAWEDRPLSLGPLTIDPLKLTAQWNGQPVPLTVTEFLVLHALIKRAGVVQTREQLMHEAFPDHPPAVRIIDGYVRRLQQRFEGLQPRFDAIEGVHGAGYRYKSGR